MIILGLGASEPGKWGTPAQTVARCAEELSRHGIRVLRPSRLFETAGVGPGRESTYVNAVIAIDSHLPPLALWRLLKRLERNAGPRSAMPWGPRALDIDILDYKGLVLGWPQAGRRRARRGVPARRSLPVTLPHPAIQFRPFVLVPLLDVAPSWRHPVLGHSARELWGRIARRREGRVLRALA
ncbi:MAG: 2-amino-4-hydroxy-6-hydroxymethyldihydropteridine diphosphokinase [Methyloligellaceae bacterium]